MRINTRKVFVPHAPVILDLIDLDKSLDAIYKPGLKSTGLVSLKIVYANVGFSIIGGYTRHDNMVSRFGYIGMYM